MMGEKKMRLCYLADAESIHVQRWARYFADSGHDVHIISYRSPNNYLIQSGSLNLHVIRRILPHIKVVSIVVNGLSVFAQVRMLIREIRPDILHAHSAGDYALIGALMGFHPFVVTVWGSDILKIPKNRTLRTRSYALKKADLVTCDGEHIMQPIEQMGVTPQKIRLIYFGVDTTKFSPARKSENLRAELGIYDSPTVVSLRNLEPLYDVKSLIESVPLVLKEIPESQFVIAGRGSEERRLRELVKSLGVSKSVKFVGFIPNDQLPQYLTSMDVYVSTSLSDAGIAVSTAEAMACGLPVIVTDFGDNRKWVKDGVNGFVIPLRDPDSLAEKIVYLLKKENVRARFGKINRKMVEEKYNYHKEMKKMESVYEESAEMHANEDADNMIRISSRRTEGGRRGVISRMSQCFFWFEGISHQNVLR